MNFKKTLDKYTQCVYNIINKDTQSLKGEFLMKKEFVFNIDPMTKEELKQERSSTTVENAWIDLQIDDRLALPNGLATVVSILESSGHLEVGVLYDTYITETYYDGQISHKKFYTTTCGSGFRRSVSGGYFSDRRRGDDGHFVTNTYKISSLKLPKNPVITEDQEKLFYIEEIEKLDDSLAYTHYVKKFDIKQLKTIYCMLKDFGGKAWKVDECGEKFRIYINNGFNFADIHKKDDRDWEINGLSTYQELRSKSNRAICESLDQGTLEISFYYDVIADEFHWKAEPFKVCEQLSEKISASVKELVEPQKDTQESELTETSKTVQNFEEKSLEEATEIIKSTMNDIKNSYIQLGNVLAQVRDEEIYKQKYSTFADYCANELDMKKSQAYNYIKVFQLYGNNEKLNDYSFSQLNLLARKNKSVDEIISSYPATLSKRELEEKLKSEKVHPGGQTKKVKNISFDENETQLVLKALELLKSQNNDININSLIEKLGGK